MTRRFAHAVALAAALGLAACGLSGGQQSSPSPTAPRENTSSTTPTPEEPTSRRPPKGATSRVCGGYERPELSTAECDLVKSTNLGLLKVETCKTISPEGNATAAAECRAHGMATFPAGQEPTVYVYGFSDLPSLKEAFDCYVLSEGIPEGDVQEPPAAGFWNLRDDPVDLQRGSY